MESLLSAILGPGGQGCSRAAVSRFALDSSQATQQTIMDSSDSVRLPQEKYSATHSLGLLCKQRGQKLVSRAPHEVYDILSLTGSGTNSSSKLTSTSCKSDLSVLDCLRFGKGFSNNREQLLLGNSVVVPIQPALRCVHHLTEKSHVSLEHPFGQNAHVSRQPHRRSGGCRTVALLGLNCLPFKEFIRLSKSEPELLILPSLGTEKAPSSLCTESNLDTKFLTQVELRLPVDVAETSKTLRRRAPTSPCRTSGQGTRSNLLVEHTLHSAWPQCPASTQSSDWHVLHASLSFRSLPTAKPPERRIAMPRRAAKLKLARCL